MRFRHRQFLLVPRRETRLPEIPEKFEDTHTQAVGCILPRRTAFLFLRPFSYLSMACRDDARITFAPFSMAYSIVGIAPRIRVSSSITPFFTGTLKSTRMKTRF